ncbi:30S ribosomal protein S8e [Candidatus Bathyarchaeota archaeon]|nr:30S ribosomal protein S8e [Candidatus Bathyarchaeota archaeon]MBS7631075.1 30S ribosomal protein S8e [Candidatus Bathyarchaeota archaeon]
MVWHSGITKRKKTGGKRKSYRDKRKFEHGHHPTETRLGEVKINKDLGRSNIPKIRLVSTNIVNVSFPGSGKTERLKILSVLSNPANIDYNRRGVITKGTIVRTDKGLAKITSRPGQDGILNAVIYTEEVKNA